MFAIWLIALFSAPVRIRLASGKFALLYIKKSGDVKPFLRRAYPAAAAGVYCIGV